MENVRRSTRNQKRFERLPREVIQDILSRLPISSVFESKCVSSQWRNFINNSHFAKMHYNRSIQNQSFSLLSGNSSFRYILDFNKCKKVIEIESSKLAFTSFLPRFSIVGSVNGLVCLEDHTQLYSYHRSSSSKHRSVVICNPVTLDWLKLPDLSILREPVRKFFGFGYCPGTGQYKVLRMGINENSGNASLEIITVGDDCWRSIGNVPANIASRVVKNVLRTESDIERYGVFLNGYLHWAMPCKNRMGTGIRAFDVEKENFVMVPFPCVNDGTNFLLLLYMGMLSVGVLCGQLMLIDNSKISEQQIWLMHEYGHKESWVHQQFVSAHSDLRLLQPFGVEKNGQVLAYCDSVNTFYSYDTKTGKKKKLKVAGPKMFSGLVLHVGTLLSLMNVLALSN